MPHEPGVGDPAGARLARSTSAQELPVLGRGTPAHNAKLAAAEPGPHRRIPGLLRQRSYSADGGPGYQPQHVQHLRPPSAPTKNVQKDARKAAAVGVEPDVLVSCERQQEAQKLSKAAEALQQLRIPFSSGFNFPEPPVAAGSQGGTAVFSKPSGKPPLGRLPPHRPRSTSLDGAAALLHFTRASRSRPHQKGIAPKQGREFLAPCGQKQSSENVDAAAAQRSHSMDSVHGAGSTVGAMAASPRLPAAPGTRAGSEQPPRQAPAVPRGRSLGQLASTPPAAGLRIKGVLRQRSISADGATTAAKVFGAEVGSAPFRRHADAPRGATPAFTAMQR